MAKAAAKTAIITITVSSDPRFSTRYFVDFRDTTGGRNSQMMVWHLNAPEILVLIEKLQSKAAEIPVELTVIDSTGEIPELSK